jgi:hypothetical protein
MCLQAIVVGVGWIIGSLSVMHANRAWHRTRNQTQIRVDGLKVTRFFHSPHLYIILSALLYLFGLPCYISFVPPVIYYLAPLLYIICPPCYILFRLLPSVVLSLLFISSFLWLLIAKLAKGLAIRTISINSLQREGLDTSFFQTVNNWRKKYTCQKHWKTVET